MVNVTWPTPVMSETFPTSLKTRVLMLKPTRKRRKAIPIWEKTMIGPSGEMKFRRLGPRRIPATIYARMSGCLSSFARMPRIVDRTIIATSCMKMSSIYDCSHSFIKVGWNVRTIARVYREADIEKLEEAGADIVARPEYVSGKKMVRELKKLLGK